MDRMSMRTQAGVSRRRLLDPQFQIEAVGSGAQDRKRSGSDFGTDAVTGKDKEVHTCRPICGRPSSLFRRQRKELRQQSLYARRALPAFAHRKDERLSVKQKVRKTAALSS